MTAIGDSRLPERFWTKVRVTDAGCWEWAACRNQYGYGAFSVSRTRMRLAHRVAYEALVGPILLPELDHLCRNRACVNPAHLEPVTGRENQLRGQTLAAANVAKTHCPKLHAYDEANTYVHPKTGARSCRACMAAYQRRLRAERSAR